MRSIIGPLTVCLFASCLCSDATTSALDNGLVVRGNTSFALDLYGKLRTREGNLFMSPYSISTALAMTWGGACGETAAQMAKALHFNAPADQLHSVFAAMEVKLAAVQAKGKVRLSVANSLWPQQGYALLPEYLDLCKKHYGTTVVPQDYASAAVSARATINAWVEDKTNRKITNLIGPGVLSSMTRMVLVNAIYFKGNWASQFDAKLTQKLPFNAGGTCPVDVPTMFQKTEFGYFEDGDLQVLDLPYAGNDLSMIVLLPRKIDGLGDLEAKLSPENLAVWTGKLERSKVKVFIPKFKMTSQFGLNNQLAALGITDAFTGKADFSGMNGRKDLYISAVIHKAFVDVNEEGTEAAAATGVIMNLKSARIEQPLPVFRADHPFLFFMRDNATGSILFLGRVADPSKI